MSHLRELGLDPELGGFYAGCMSDHRPDDELDARGFLCPLPVLKARKRLLALEAGQALRLITDDPAAIVDVPHFCAEQGYTVSQVDGPGPDLIFLIRK